MLHRVSTAKVVANYSKVENKLLGRQQVESLLALHSLLQECVFTEEMSGAGTRS